MVACSLVVFVRTGHEKVSAGLRVCHGKFDPPAVGPVAFIKNDLIGRGIHIDNKFLTSSKLRFFRHFEREALDEIPGSLGRQM